MRDASGNPLVDMSSEPDSFGHRRLLGAGKYVVKQIEDRIKADPEIKEFMKRTGQFVAGVYEIPEVREIRPQPSRSLRFHQLWIQISVWKWVQPQSS